MLSRLCRSAPQGGAQRGPREHFGMVFEKGSTLRRCVNRALNRLWLNGTIKKLQTTYLARAGAPDIR